MTQALEEGGVLVLRRGGQGFLERASSYDARSWFASVVLRFGERVVRSFGVTSESKCANRCF